MSDFVPTVREIKEGDLEPLDNAIQVYKDRVLSELPPELRLKLERLISAFGRFAREQVHGQILREYGAPPAQGGES